MGVHKLLNSANLASGESPASLQPYRIQPELRDFVVTFHMNVNRFISVNRIKKEPVGANSQDRWRTS
jgi:hypothetical protein